MPVMIWAGPGRTAGALWSGALYSLGCRAPDGLAASPLRPPLPAGFGGSEPPSQRSRKSH